MTYFLTIGLVIWRLHILHVLHTFVCMHMQMGSLGPVFLSLSTSVDGYGNNKFHRDVLMLNLSWSQGVICIFRLLESNNWNQNAK